MNKLLILLLLPLSIIAQTFEFEANTRSAKTDTVFDYYFKASVNYDIDSNNSIYMMGNFEREAGADYFSNRMMYINKFVTFDKYFDTEDNVDYAAFKLYCPISLFVDIPVYIAAGYDYTYNIMNDSHNHNLMLAVKWQFISAIIAGFDGDIYKFEYKINPTKKLTEKFSFGLIISGYSFDNNYKWRNGLTLKYKL